MINAADWARSSRQGMLGPGIGLDELLPCCQRSIAATVVSEARAIGCSGVKRTRGGATWTLRGHVAPPEAKLLSLCQ